MHFLISQEIEKTIQLEMIEDEMTQQQLAEKAGVSRQTIIAIEGGKYSPSLDLAYRIAHAFGAHIGEVFSYQIKDN